MRPLWLALLVLAVVAISGCTASSDLTGIAKLLPDVKAFLAENPNAQVRAVLLSAKAVSAAMPSIEQDCGAPLEVKAYYRISITDTNLDATLWVDPASNQVACAVRRGTPPSPGPTPIDESTACTRKGGTWYDGKASCLPCPAGNTCVTFCQPGCLVPEAQPALCKTGIQENPEYQKSSAPEQEFTGIILLSTCPAGPTTLMRCPAYRFQAATDSFAIGYPAGQTELIDALLEQRITLRGKLITFQLEGQELTELQIAALPCTSTSDDDDSASCKEKGGTWACNAQVCPSGTLCTTQPSQCQCSLPEPEPEDACEAKDGLWYDGKDRCLPCPAGNTCVTFCQPGCVENPTDQQRCEYAGGGGICLGLPPPSKPNQTFIAYAAQLGLDKAAFSACVESRAFQKEVLSDQSAGTSAGVSGTPTFFVNGQQVVGAYTYDRFAKIIEAELKNASALAVSADDDPALGSEKAPVTIVEFADFAGPFSARFAKDTLPQVKKNYLDTGKARLVFRDFPLSFYANDQAASEAAECAHAQGSFWAYHDRLFLRQSEWSGGIIPVPPPDTTNSTTGSNSSAVANQTNATTGGG